MSTVKSWCLPHVPKGRADVEPTLNGTMSRSPLTAFIRRLHDARPREGDPRAVALVLESLDVDEAAWEPFAYSVADRYTRNCVYRDDDFEVLVLCWPAGVSSPIHDHGRSRCAFRVLRGDLQVDDFVRVHGGRAPGAAQLASAGPTRLLRAGSVDAIAPQRDIHRVGALGVHAVSLHVYAAPLDDFLIFDLEQNACRGARARYDTVAS